MVGRQSAAPAGRAAVLVGTKAYAHHQPRQLWLLYSELSPVLRRDRSKDLVARRPAGTRSDGLRQAWQPWISKVRKNWMPLPVQNNGTLELYLEIYIEPRVVLKLQLEHATATVARFELVPENTITSNAKLFMRQQRWYSGIRNSAPAVLLPDGRYLGLAHILNAARMDYEHASTPSSLRHLSASSASPSPSSSIRWRLCCLPNIAPGWGAWTLPVAFNMASICRAMRGTFSSRSACRTATRASRACRWPGQ